MRDWPRVIFPSDRDTQPGPRDRHETLIIAQVGAVTRLEPLLRALPAQSPTVSGPLSRNIPSGPAVPHPKGDRATVDCRRSRGHPGGHGGAVPLGGGALPPGVAVRASAWRPSTACRRAPSRPSGLGPSCTTSGKLEVPERILAKPGRLTEREWARLRHHPEAGLALVQRLGFDEAVAEIVLYHHERIDGSGYPDWLVGGGDPVGGPDRQRHGRVRRPDEPAGLPGRPLDRRGPRAAGPRGGRPLLPVGRERPALASARDARSTWNRTTASPTSRTRCPARPRSRSPPRPGRLPAPLWTTTALSASAVGTGELRTERDSSRPALSHCAAAPARSDVTSSRSVPVQCPDDRSSTASPRSTAGLKAVDNLSFSVAGGEVVGLIGPNGAGKTSTLKCMVGIQAPERRDRPHRRPRHRRRRDRGEAPAGLHARRAAAVRLPDGARAPRPGRAALRRDSTCEERSQALLQELELSGQGDGAARRAVARA